MKKLVSLILVAIIISGIIYWIFFQKSPTGNNLVSPLLGNFKQEQKVQPSPSPNMKTPVEFKFDSTTDLSVELNKINPEVTDQDFSQLQ